MRSRALDPHGPDAGRWYAAFRAGLVAGREQPMVASAGATLTSLRTNATNLLLDRRPFGVWDGDVCLGGMIVNLSRTANAHTVDLELAVAPEFRNRGAGTELFRAAVDLARAEGRRVVSAEVHEPVGTGFALDRGFTIKLTERRYLLGIPAAPVPATVPDGYRTEVWTGPVDAAVAPGFATMRTLMEQDVPVGDRDHEPEVFTADRVLAADKRLANAGWGMVTALLLAPDGTPAGYSRILVDGTKEVDNGKEDALQDDTFVLGAHRGRRLGAVLKSAALARLEADFPTVRHLHTWTADGNDAMIATNLRFGFRPVETTHTVEATV
ncbi:GNAT family N-acetyltransferase [Actinoplanes couchii]|uniref:N-acetyltransferase domain-containing protein n=1 Tax=Actinoplanes couchii TaxID=403638 RepID=A0ABQ3XDJ3_9ACTN|nr:GNAT family N-acetyltransferase [Actinoplanes couchii]MDR6317069.1 GNAT superfamily N-acetyltransferase [Actinoplanes couchii]GID56564.1 hypothetical protein Aco03nite_049680 [Actinoplanes couchii]